MARPNHPIIATPGVPIWNAVMDDLFVALNSALTRFGREPEMEVLRCPPVLSREVFERSGFAISLPQLFGSIHSFCGDSSQHERLTTAIAQGTDWSPELTATSFVLTPAACYPVYPLHTGLLPPSGATVDVSSFCFRHEPSDEIGRFVAFQQREFVMLGELALVQDWFDQWKNRALAFASELLGLTARLEVASDPFFGGGGRLLGARQREQHLKFEVVAPIEGRSIAIASCNYHRDRFGQAFRIQAGSSPAHTACVGFGIERFGLALLSQHGDDPELWPQHVKRQLSL